MSIIISKAICPQDHTCPAIRICPVAAITQKGFELPRIEQEKCISFVQWVPLEKNKTMKPENYSLSHDENCFVCGSKNEEGLQLKFQIVDGGVVETEFLPKTTFQSYKNTLHGGVQALLLDSCMVQAVRSLGFLSKTAKLELKYKEQVSLVESLRVKAFVKKRMGSFFLVEAQIHQSEFIKTIAFGTFRILDKE